MSEGRPDSGFGMGEKVNVAHERKTEGGITMEVTAEPEDERRKKLLEAALKKKFCLDCGKPLVAILLLACEGCGAQFLVEYDETLKQIVLTPLLLSPEGKAEGKA